MSKKFNLIQDRDDDSITHSIKRHVVVFFLLVMAFALILAIVIGATMTGAFSSGIARQQHYEAIFVSPDGTVTLKAMPGQTMVSTYDDIAGRGATDIVKFRDGLSCQYVSGPTTTVIGMNTFELYHVRCDGNFVDVSGNLIENDFVLPD